MLSYPSTASQIVIKLLSPKHLWQVSVTCRVKSSKVKLKPWHQLLPTFPASLLQTHNLASCPRWVCWVRCSRPACEFWFGYWPSVWRFRALDSSSEQWMTVSSTGSLWRSAEMKTCSQCLSQKMHPMHTSCYSDYRWRGCFIQISQPSLSSGLSLLTSMETRL